MSYKNSSNNLEENVEITVNSDYNISDEDSNEIIKEQQTVQEVVSNVVDENLDEKKVESEMVMKEEEHNNEGPIFVHTDFGNKTQPVQFTIIATGQVSNTSITGGKLRLIYGRIYFLPIDTNKDITSDNFANIKIFSDISGKIDVRYISNGYAAILPLQNNITLVDKTRLCVLW